MREVQMWFSDYIEIGEFSDNYVEKNLNAIIL